MDPALLQFLQSLYGQTMQGMQVVPGGTLGSSLSAAQPQMPQVPQMPQAPMAAPEAPAMDPLQRAIAAMTMAQNPELAAQAATQAGIPPPTLSGWDATVTPEGGGLGSAITGQPDPLAALKGVKAPQAERPIMNAGVSGSQRAPELSAASGGGSQILQQIIAAMSAGRQNPLTVPGLGAMIGGGR